MKLQRAQVLFSLKVALLPLANEVRIPACIALGIPACLAGGIPACLAGGGFQAHTQGGSWGVWPRGVSRPTPGGVYPSMYWGRPPPGTATAEGGMHPTGMHSCIADVFSSHMQTSDANIASFVCFWRTRMCFQTVHDTLMVSGWWVLCHRMGDGTGHHGIQDGHVLT